MPEEWFVTLKECKKRCNDWFWFGMFLGVAGTLAVAWAYFKIMKATILVF